MRRDYTIFIVDHVISDLDNDGQIQIVPTPEGTKIITD
jgi:hypothetical protein